MHWWRWTRRKREPGKEFTIGYDRTSIHLLLWFQHCLQFDVFRCSWNRHESGYSSKTEVNEVLKTIDGKLTYDMLNRMQYLDAVINEAFRLWPSCCSGQKMCERFRTTSTARRQVLPLKEKDDRLVSCLPSTSRSKVFRKTGRVLSRTLPERKI